MLLLRQRDAMDCGPAYLQGGNACTEDLRRKEIQTKVDGRYRPTAKGDTDQGNLFDPYRIRSAISSVRFSSFVRFDRFVEHIIRTFASKDPDRSPITLSKSHLWKSSLHLKCPRSWAETAPRTAERFRSLLSSSTVKSTSYTPTARWK